MAKSTFIPYSISWGFDEGRPTGSGGTQPHYKVVSPLFDTDEFKEFVNTVPTLRRISIGPFIWAGDAIPTDQQFWGKQDFLSGKLDTNKISMQDTNPFKGVYNFDVYF